jgi:RNA-directed DNA polymerase
VLVIQPTRKSIDRLQDKTKKLISKERPLESIIRDLNPVLRGWSEYYRISYHSKEVYITLGHEVWKKMWAWARKKHVSKTAKEITSKYLIPGKGHKWTWGKSLTETLFNLAEVTTWVMRPLKLDRNPYLL